MTAEFDLFNPQPLAVDAPADARQPASRRLAERGNLRTAEGADRRAAERVADAPLLLAAHPAQPQLQAHREAAAAPAKPALTQLAALTPPPSTPSNFWQKLFAPHEARSIPASLPGADSHTAIYDIAAHTVYLPDGETLEAHSGLGGRLDDPRYVDEKARGPTPPNVYALTLREELFHGVRAIRLNPVNDGKMYGRDGILAHTYMLGPSGQSFGCVSFKDYPQFLKAFLRGEIDRLVVVPHLETMTSEAARPGRAEDRRYAVND